MSFQVMRALWLLTLTLLLLPFQNCGILHTPTGATNMASTASFDHTGLTASCASCHQTGASFAVFPASGHIDINGQDCSSCHNTASWLTAAGGNPHGAGLPVPNSCLACHSNKLPTGPQGSVALTGNTTPSGGFFDHSGNGGSGDCATCHLAVPANAGVTWSGAVFNHSPTPTTCRPCHTSAQQPTGAIGSPSFDHAVSGLGDCGSCHNSPANIGRTWAVATFSHSPLPTSCASCHAADSLYTGIQNSIKNQMNHSTLTLPDCATCHTSAAQTNGFTAWQNEAVINGQSTALTTRGVFHAHIGTQPSNCQNCHSGERPTTTVGTPAFNHAVNGQGDCSTCHANSTANIGMTWSGGTVSHAGVTNCASCHASELPSGTVPNLVDGFTHAATFGTECFSCHYVVKANAGVTWSGGFFNHNNNNSASFSSCSPCHDNRHHNAGTNCTSCHRSVTYPSANSNGNYGGSFGGG